MVHGVPTGNILAAAAILFTGLTYARIAAFAAAMNLSPFYKIYILQDPKSNFVPCGQRGMGRTTGICHG